MTEMFSAKLDLVLKALVISRAQLAAEVAVDKSAVGRWCSGAVVPSGHNLTRITAAVRQRVPGFTILDWDSDPETLAAKVGADPRNGGEGHGPALALALSCLPRAHDQTELRGKAYEGFYRSTRVSGRNGDHYMHDYSIVRLAENGLLKVTMVTAGIITDTWLLPVHNQLYCVGTERATDTPVFGIFHATNGLKAQVLDGLIMTSIQDVGRTPTASPVIYHRIADLSGDSEKDEAFFASLFEREATSKLEDSPPELLAHLRRDVGPAAAALGGDILMQAPLSRSKTT